MADFSGPGSPNDNFVQAEIMASTASLESNGNAAAVPPHPSHGDAGTAVAPMPSPVQSLNVKLQLAHAQPFSVYISTSKTHGVTLISVEVHIRNLKKDVYHTVVSHGEPIHLDDDSNIHIFPFSDVQLSHLLPHLEVGNMVEVKIKYRTIKPGELKVGIISRKHHHILGKVIEHLLHLKGK